MTVEQSDNDRDTVESPGDSDAEPSIPETATIYPLVAESGNKRVLRQWLDNHASYQAVDADTPLSEAEFDVCVVDGAAFREHRETLAAVKSAAAPTLLPVLLLLPENRTELIETDQGEIADNVLTATVDEVVSVPIKQAELEWRIRALLRMRSQSLGLQSKREELELFQQAVESSGHAVYITDTDGTIEYVNPAFEAITGYRFGEAVGRTPSILDSGEMSEAYFEAFWEQISAGEVWEAEIVNRRKSGELYTASQTVAPVTDEDGVRGYVAVQTDITERKEREEMLRRRTRAIEEAPVGVSITDPTREDNPMIYVNEAFEELTGYSREEVLGRNCRFLQGERTDPDRVAEIRAAIDDERPVAVELLNYRKDGTEFWSHLEIAPVTDDEGDVVNWVGFQQDVTERKQREKQMNVLDRVLRHNLRNEMNIIRGRAETIQARSAEEVAADAERIIATSDRLIETVEKEREITQQLAESPEYATIDVTGALRQTVATVAEAHPEATITMECPDGITAWTVTDINRALEELLVNAAVHNDTTPRVAVTVTTGENCVRIDVADNGPAIPEMERDVLLGTWEETPVSHGGGLGLWLVNLIVTRSGGEIAHEHNDPRGNVVTVKLPRTEAVGTCDQTK